MTTLHFRAEGFEATATEVEAADCCYVVTVQGATPHSVRIESCNAMGDRWDCRYLAAAHGWTRLCSTMGETTIEQSLALAISLLYSVPGVEWVERVEPKPDPIMRMIDDFCDRNSRSG